jgi:RNA polymerase sigma-70 factor (ECF subfamily)
MIAGQINFWCAADRQQSWVAGRVSLPLAMAEPSEVGSLADQTDAELARLAVSRAAPMAEAELCARFAPRVRSYGRRHLRSEDAAAELVQRVLVVLLEKLRSGGLREPERIASFVLGSARITALAMRRRQAREQPVEPSTELAVASAAEPDVVAARHLARCFDALGDRERDTLLGTYYGEQSSEQIARALGVSCENVRQIRRRAMSQVRQCLGLDAEVST